MSSQNLILIGLLGTIFAFPITAKADDLELLNFNVGGGLTVPLNPTAHFVGVNGSATIGAGANFNKHNSIEGDFMWNGLSHSVDLVHPLNTPTGSINVFSLTGEYRFHVDGIAHSAFGLYAIGGGGWYYRHTDINKNYFVPPLTVCQPIYNWWGFSCDSGGFVSSVTIASHGSSSGGVNAGAGFSVRVGDEGWKFFVESRYTYVWTNFIRTTFVPVTFGFRFN